ncbi:MAG: carboxylesterase/lipase family protein [Clostridia bacterium]|nr:carboxylesterase/lipase family protein [Clostridia bacterium]
MAEFNLRRRTTYGPVEGFVDELGPKWLGIPFAAPPVGDLRFRRAVPPEPWEEPKVCTVISPKPVNFYLGSKKGCSEDCLYLNVWAPDSVLTETERGQWNIDSAPDRRPNEEKEKLPVFVFLYGGANSMGSSAQPDYSVQGFAKDGIIGVNFNYRVGPLGFYDFSRIDDHFESNCALSDAIAALKWVHENIAEFGGDPENVTICGESAGGGMVFALLAAPSAQPYFQKAIAMSGLPDNGDSIRANELCTEAFLKKLRLPSEDVLKLKDMPIKKLQKGAKAVTKINKKYPGLLPAGTEVDGDLIPVKSWEALASGQCKDKICMFGTCEDDGTMFTVTRIMPKKWKDIEKMLENSDASEQYEKFRAVYEKAGSTKKAMHAIARGRMFWADTVRVADIQSQWNDVYCYRFDFVSGLEKFLRVGALHGSDIGPGLDTWEGTANQFTNTWTSKKKLTKIHAWVHGAFVQFAKTGDPNGANHVHGPRWTAKDHETFLFNVKCSMEYDPEGDYFEAWRDLHLYP